MLRKIIFLVLFIILLVPLYAKSNEIYFKFQISSREEINKLTKIISIDNIKDNTVYAYANQKELLEFVKLGYFYTELQHPGKLRIPKMSDNIKAMQDWDTYPTYQTYVDLMYQFEVDHPDICSVTKIGYSVEVREIIVAKISDYDKNLLDVGTEIKAMEKVFQKVLPELTGSVSELSRITKGIKGKKKTSE